MLCALAQDDERVRFWKQKGLFQLKQLKAALSTDGTHLNNWMDYPKYLKNIRANVVSAMKVCMVYKRVSKFHGICLHRCIFSGLVVGFTQVMIGLVIVGAAWEFL